MGTKMGLIVVDEKKNKLVEVIGSEKKLLGELFIHISKGISYSLIVHVRKFYLYCVR